MSDGVVFLPSFHEAIRELPDAERLGAYDAVVHYGLYGEVVEMSPVVKSLFALMKPVIDSSQNRYRAAKENGNKPPKDPDRKRGRPPKNQTKNQSGNQTQNQDIDKDIDSDKDSDFDKDSDSKTDNETEKEKESARVGGWTIPAYRPLNEDDWEKQREAQIAKLGVTW